jgi:hypothetical protein
VMRTTAVRHAVFGLALAGLAMSSIATANAGDLDAPAYSPYPYGAPDYERMLERERHYSVAPRVYRRVEVGDGICRILHQRRVDPYGREIIHRIRMCDEGPVYPSPNWTAVPPEYGYQPRPNYEPSPSGYYSYPRPPAAIGQGYYN